jgi:uncharacterized protein (TIGR00369 family)
MTDATNAAAPAPRAGGGPAPAPVPRERLLELPGRRVLEMMLAGELPPAPFAGIMGVELVEVGEGRVVFAGRPGAGFLNPLGTVHGGWTATLLNSAMGCAVHSALPPGRLYTTTSMTVNYVRALPGDGEAVRCEASAVHVGARSATSEGRLWDARGRLVAHGSETCMVFDAPPPRPG